MFEGRRVRDRMSWLPSDDGTMPVIRHERFGAQTPVIP